MIKAIEELQEAVRDMRITTIDGLQTQDLMASAVGLLHQLAVKVERLEKRGKPRLMMERNRIRQVPEDEEGGP